MKKLSFVIAMAAVAIFLAAVSSFAQPKPGMMW
jgi:hypothetical protein